MVPSGSTALSSSAGTNVVTKKMGIIETIKQILHNGGLKELWRGLGPALILVINPIIQYTVFEQLKNLLITRRTARLRAAGNKSALAVLTDLDYFWLGALSKLGL